MEDKSTPSPVREIDIQNGHLGSPFDTYSPVELEGPPKKSCLQSLFIEVIETLILALVLFIVINTVTARIRVDGSSMEPSFHHNDYVIVNKLSYRLGDFERGDVIIFPNPYNPDEDFIKRVVGLPGDVIQVVDGRLYVNGMMMDEPYLGEPMNKDMSEKVVPEGTLFVMGDNRNDSSDSRAWGPLEIENVLGKAVFVYWPFDGIGLVDDHTVEAANQ